MNPTDISFKTRKALCHCIGDAAANEIVLVLQRLQERVAELEQRRLGRTSNALPQPDPGVPSTEPIPDRAEAFRPTLPR